MSLFVQIAVVWKIVKATYGEEFVQNSINSVSNNRDEVHSVGNNSTVLENKTNNLREIEADQKSKSKNVNN